MSKSNRTENDSKVVASADQRRPPAAGKGRKKGVPNKTTRTLREAIEKSFDQVGGVSYLVQMATEQPVAYMGLLAKVLPQQLKVQTDTPIEVVFRTV